MTTEKTNAYGIETVLFDLDNTIMDHAKVQNTSLRLIYEEYENIFNGVPLDDFMRSYIEYNEVVWDMLIRGEIDKETLRLRRFSDILEKFDLDTAPAHEMTTRYLEIYGKQAFFMDGAREAVEYLAERYPLGLITNGFTDIQEIKLNRLGIRESFRMMITSDEAGVMKPDPKIFKLAAERMGSTVEKCVYIGDKYDVDIVGAAAAGMKAFWYNPFGKECPAENQCCDEHFTDFSVLKSIL